MPFVSCSKFNQSQALQDQAIADFIAGGASPTGAAGGDLEGTYPNPTVKDQAIVDAVTGSTAVQTAVAGVFNRCDGTDMPAGASLIECSAKGTDIPYLVSGVIPATQLPSFVDDVLEFPALANFPVTGEAGKIYIDASTGKTYRWNGTGYTEISASAGVTVQNEGSVLTTAATSLNFVGAGINATSSGGAVTVTVPSATTTQSGTSELATTAETIAGTSTATVVTPAGLKAVTDSLSLPTDTYIFTGGGRPTGTPIDNGGSSYAQNAEGELFLYNGTEWVLIGNGIFKEFATTHSPAISVPSFGPDPGEVVRQYVAPRDGIIVFTGFVEGTILIGDTASPSRLAMAAILTKNGILHSKSGQNISYYSSGDGLRGTHSTVIHVAAGDLLELRCAMDCLDITNQQFLVTGSNLSVHYTR